jgi:dihydroorotate dehydrogenase (fumarate)
MTDLSTDYLGLRLAHPFMAGASPVADSLDSVRRLEDSGCSAIVLRSLFEEQITMAASGRIHGMDPHEREFAAVLSEFPDAAGYVFGPDAYLEHLRRVKNAVAIPVFGSLNGTTSSLWFSVAKQIEQAGADGLELNMYDVVAQPTFPGMAVERRIRDVVAELKATLAIPVAAKLSPFFTAFGHLAHELEKARVDGLVLFNRFYQPDIDIESMTTVPSVTLSTSADLLLRLRWLAVLHGRVRASLAVTGGVAEPADGIKAILAGADAVQQVSAVLRNGPGHFAAMRTGLTEWMERHQVATLREVRGRVSLRERSDPSAFERGTYIRMLQSWSAKAD